MPTRSQNPLTTTSLTLLYPFLFSAAFPNPILKFVLPKVRTGTALSVQ